MIDKIIWFASTIANVLTWVALIHRDRWKRVRLIAALEFATLPIAVLVYFAQGKAWWTLELWQTKEIVLIALQLGMMYATTCISKSWLAVPLPWMHGAYIVLQYAQKCEQEIGADAIVNVLYRTMLWEALTMNFLLAFVLWTDRIGPMYEVKRNGRVGRHQAQAARSEA